MADYAKPTKHGGQKGEFVGDPSAIHIHLVADNNHVTVAGKRKDFYLEAGKVASVRTAIDHLKQYGRPGSAGYNNCLKYLTDLARGVTRPNAAANK